MTQGELVVKMTEVPVYLRNDQEKMVVRSTPGRHGKTYARFSGSKEFEVKENGNLVMDSIMMGDEITKEEYYNY